MPASNATPEPIQIPVALLRRVIGMQQQLGPALGEPDEIVLIESQAGDHRFEVSVWRQARGVWSMKVTIHPPPIGLAVLRCLSRSFESIFNPQGVALIRDIPEDYLLAYEANDAHLLLEFIG